MHQYSNDHVAAELKVFEGFLESNTSIFDHKWIEEDQVDGKEDLNGGDDGVEIHASFALLEGLEEIRQWALCEIFRMCLNFF